MSAEIEEKLHKVPVVRSIVKLLKLVILPGFKGLSLYDLLEIYTVAGDSLFTKEIEKKPYKP